MRLHWHALAHAGLLLVGIPFAGFVCDVPRRFAIAVRAALDEEDEPVVLVRHSYGGMVITDAAAGQENVEHLVYVTPVMPEIGETMADFGGEPGPWMDPNPEDGTMGLKAELAPGAFMQDCEGVPDGGTSRPPGSSTPVG